MCFAVWFVLATLCMLSNANTVNVPYCTCLMEQCPNYNNSTARLVSLPTGTCQRLPYGDFAGVAITMNAACTSYTVDGSNCNGKPGTHHVATDGTCNKAGESFKVLNCKPNAYPTMGHCKCTTSWYAPTDKTCTGSKSKPDEYSYSTGCFTSIRSYSDDCSLLWRWGESNCQGPADSFGAHGTPANEPCTKLGDVNRLVICEKGSAPAPPPSSAASLKITLCVWLAMAMALAAFFL
eukprot:TRINITY_DN3158_c0_g1_i1.p1 TRINITY_DN3158_c0_g1~~TRINITY_DN3158_c0_g1_i1.p1  ORF type:complete len:236 (+),score=22.61 TRINITY_DN3158_c0_g1_i1:42-749(+)